MLLPLILFWNFPIHLCNDYETRVILDNLRRPNSLVYHKYTSTLFFSHTVNKTGLDFEIVAYDVSKNTSEIIDVPGGCTIAYDRGNNDVYFGGHDGIYKYSYILEQAEFFAENNKSIWSMDIGSNFYYIEYPTMKLFVYVDDRFEPVYEARDIEIDNFHISKGYIYYTNRTATFKIDRKTKETVMLDDEVKVRHITQDVYGDIYFCGTGGIYVEYKPNYKLNKIVNIRDVFGLTFDDNNDIIFSDDNGIYKLLPDRK